MTTNSLLERRTAVVIALLATAWCALAISPPLLQAAGHDATAVLTRLVFDTVCHQLPARAIHIEGNPMAVCARCAGIYSGLALGCWAQLLRRRGQPEGHSPLLIAAAIVLIEWSAEVFGMIDGPIAMEARAVSGTLFGLTASRYFVPAAICMIVDLSEMLARRARRSESHAEAG